MRQFVVILILLFAVGSIRAGAWLAANPPVGVFLTHDAVDVRVISGSVRTQVITYRITDVATNWRVEVGGKLADAGWADTFWWRTDEPMPSSTRKAGFGICEIWERVDLGGAHDEYVIVVRRWIEPRGGLKRLWWPRL